MRRFLLAALLCAPASLVQAQATATVSPDEPVYGFIDHLVSARLVDSVIVGQRPLSRQQIAGILARVRVPPDREDSIWLQRSLQHYRAWYPLETSDSRHPRLNGASVAETIANSPGRGIPPDADGAIDADVNPLLANRLGVTQVDGWTHNMSLEAELPLAPWATLVARPRLTDFSERGTQSSAVAGRVDKAYLRFLVGKLSVTAGRDYVFFGQGMTAGITNSMNPRGFDMVRVSSEAPFVVPLLSRLFGPFMGTAFLADLGTDQRFPHTHLFNYKVSARPFSALEIGATLTDEIGGQGAPGGTFLQKVEDVFPLLDATVLHRTLRFSNKFSGIDARFRVPHARGLQLYMDGALDDFDLRRFRSSVTEDGGYVWGAVFDCFVECGELKMTGEYHVTGLRYYTHSTFSTGYTLDRQLIGDQLGPRGKGAYLTVDLDRLTNRVKVDLAHEIRSGDKYGATSTTSNDSDFHFVLLEHHPAERRWRAIATTFLGNSNGQVTMRFAAGGERVEHFAFQPGSWRTNGLVEVGLDWRPGGSRR